MGRSYDATGIDADLGFEPLPKGTYDLIVKGFKEAETKNGDYMVKVELDVINDEKFAGRRVWHNVTFLPKDRPGAGFAVNWLKTIGQPFDGKINITPEAWVGKMVSAYLVIDEYEGKKNNKISQLLPYRGAPQTEEQVPF